MFAVLAGVSLTAQTLCVSPVAFGAEYSAELQDAYNWAYGKGVTTMTTIDNANMYGAITRAEMAKMLSVYAKDVLGYKADTSKACSFTDIDSVKGDLHDYIIESCQLGLMGQGITAFRPYDTISRAEFGTALSRTLWGDKYEGGTPYYANHLNALKAAGIMNQIANAESTKEVRWYVMLMLMRSDEGWVSVDCDDPVIALACSLDTDECPAACKEDANNDEPTVVKSGDLAVSADAASNRKILKTGTSDLDTLTFKTSENVEITKVTLERYGYSTDDDSKITGIWLEDEDGNTIAESKTLSKDKVTLNIKKDYRKVDGEFKATIVVSTSGAAGTIGFKVADVESTAKNLNLDNYSPYTYEVVDYAGAEVTVTMKGTAKDYNYEEGESYEVAKLKLKAGNNTILVKGFTLKNNWKLDMQKFLDKAVVKADSEEISATVSANKDDELVVSFAKDYEIAMNKSATFAVNATFADFDDYGETVAYYVEKSSSINVVESKNGTRTTVTGDVNDPTKAIAHKFAGGKIKLSNTKLWNVDAAQGSEGNVVAEGNITISEPLSKVTFTIPVTGDGAQYIDHFTMFINGDEYEAKKDGTSGSGNIDYKFSNVSIDKSGKIQFKLDIKDPSGSISGKIKFVNSFNSAAISGSKYDNSNNTVQATDIAGSISFSEVTIQAAKASLENSATKKVEFIKDETNRKVVFDGTYKAKKGDVDLNKFYVTVDGTTGATTLDSKNKVTFYLFIDGEEVADTDNIAGQEESFSDVRVKADATVKVKVEAEVEAYGQTGDLATYRLHLEWTDMNGNENTGKGDDAMVAMSIKVSGSTKIDSSAKDTVLLKANNQTLAKFVVKPSNSNDDGITLDTLEFSAGTLNTGDIRVKIDGSEYDADGNTLKYSPNEKIPTEWLTVEIVLKKETAGMFTVNNIQVNGWTASTKTFSKYFVPALVTVSAQENKGDYTKFTVEVDEADDDITVSALKFYVNSWSTCSSNAAGTGLAAAGNCKEVAKITTSVEDGDSLEADNIKETTQSITAIEYMVWSDKIVISKDKYEDFFKVGSETLRVFSNK